MNFRRNGAPPEPPAGSFCRYYISEEQQEALAQRQRQGQREIIQCFVPVEIPCEPCPYFYYCNSLYANLKEQDRLSRQRGDLARFR